LPTLAALQLVADSFNAKGIKVHFDVGNNYQLPSRPDFIIDSNITATLTHRGGEAIEETDPALQCDPTKTNPSGSLVTCLFLDYPGTVDWKAGFYYIKSGDATGTRPAHFDSNRKDIFHYAVSAHALGLPKWWY